jgi:hypothetical protein
VISVANMTGDATVFDGTTTFNPGAIVGGTTTINSLGNLTANASLQALVVSGTVNLTGGTVATATAVYKVLSATASSGVLGTGYTNGDKLVVNENSKIVLSVTGVNGTGGITNLSVVVNGPLESPLTGSKTVTSLSSSGTGAQVDLICAIDTITVTNSGDGWTSVPPTVTIGVPSSTGVQATATAVLTSNTGDNVKVIEAWTVDAGLNVYLRYIGEYN